MEGIWVVRHRLIGLSAKPAVPRVPAVPLDWDLVIALNGRAETYVEFRQPRFWGSRQSREIDAVGLEALGAGYFIRAEEGDPSPDEFACCYLAVFSNDNLPRACESLLQHGIRARLHLLVRPRSEVLCTFVIGTSRDASHILAQFFPDLTRINARLFHSIAAGRLIRPLVLTSLTLPTLPGMDDAGPLPVDFPSVVPVHDQAIHVGQVLSPYDSRALGPAVLTPADLLRGTLLMGTMGSGKSNLADQIVIEASRYSSILIFDIKRDHRPLKRLVGAKIYGFNGQSFSHNILKPEGPADQWAKKLGDITSEVIFRNSPAVGSKDMVVKDADELFRARGLYDDPPSTNYPHIGDLAEKMEAESQATRADRQRGWYASALRVLGTLGVGSTRAAFHVREGLSIKRLLEGVVVIELDGIGDAAGSALLVSVLLEKIRAYRMTQPERDVLRHLVVIEEAQNLFSRGQEATSFLADAARELRSLGVGLVYLTQMPSRFSRDALANVNAIFGMKLVLPEDKSVAANILGLEGEAAKLIGELGVGQAFMKTDRLSLIRIPQVPRPVVHDSELERTIVTPQEIATSFAQRKDVENRIAHLPPRMSKIFCMVCEGVAVYPTALKTTLGYSHSDVDNDLGLLVRRGLLNYLKAKKTGVARDRTVYFPSPTGKEAYRQLRGRYPDRKTGPSVTHSDAMTVVLQKLGIHRKPHERFDILFDEGEAERAIEVETGANNDEQLATNISKSLEFQGEARFVAVDHHTYNRILQACTRMVFTERKPLTLRVALVESLPKWDEFEFKPVPTHG